MLQIQDSLLEKHARDKAKDAAGQTFATAKDKVYASWIHPTRNHKVELTQERSAEEPPVLKVISQLWHCLSIQRLLILFIFLFYNFTKWVF